MQSETLSSIQAMREATAPQQANQPADFVPLHLKTRTHASLKVYPHPNSKEKNKLAAQHAADMKANRWLRKICADKAFIMDGARLLFLVTAIGAQGIVKATTGMELWSDPVLIAITSGVTVNALSAFLRVIHSLFPLSRSADQQEEKRMQPARKSNAPPTPMGCAGKKKALPFLNGKAFCVIW